MADRFDEILQNRKVPQAPSNLATRIIDASKGSAPQSVRGRRSWMEILMDNFLMPQPAFAMAVILLLGFYFGFSFEATYMPDQDLSILYIDAMEAGDWL